MDRQFDFRALLLQIQDRLSNDDRHRLHFLVGDIIPRMQRENVTLAGTLTLLESLFDRAVINEDYMDFLIRIFCEIQCYDAVERLREFQLSKESPKERTLTVSDLLDDNIENDKHRTSPYDPLALDDSYSGLSYKADVLKKTTNEFIPLSPEKSNLRKMTRIDTFSIAPEIPGETVDELSKPRPGKSRPKKCFKFPLIYYLYILFFLQILFLIIYLWIFIRKKLAFNLVENRYHQEVYILKNGKFPDRVDGKWFNHSEDLLLTYTDRLIRIDAYVNHDDMYSIKFLYSQNKSMEHRLRNVTEFNSPTLASLDFQQRNIQEITQCYKNISQSTRLIGLFFAFKDKTSMLLGSCHEQMYLEDKFSKHIFGYASGKTTTTFLTGLQFTWFKICPIVNRVTLCTSHDPYILRTEAFYKV